jgi:hypothetical protein
LERRRGGGGGTVNDGEEPVVSAHDDDVPVLHLPLRPPVAKRTGAEGVVGRVGDGLVVFVARPFAKDKAHADGSS